MANGLRSCTQNVREFVVKTPSAKYVIADMPGFDNTHLSDGNVLRMIADWLEKK